MGRPGQGLLFFYLIFKTYILLIIIQMNTNKQKKIKGHLRRYFWNWTTLELLGRVWGAQGRIWGQVPHLHIGSQQKCSKDHSLPGKIQTAALVKVNISVAFCFSCRSTNLPRCQGFTETGKVLGYSSSDLENGARAISGPFWTLVEASCPPSVQLHNK